MTINELVQMVHENAVAHGWWEEERAMEEVIALIHSEWSEALEEARAGRPLAYVNALEVVDGSRKHIIVERGDDGLYEGKDGKTYTGLKPEGVAVELMDGCIRILDALGWMEYEFTEGETDKPTEIDKLFDGRFIESDTIPEKLPTIVAMLHAYTSNAYLSDIKDEDDDALDECDYFFIAMSLAMTWVKNHGVDPLKLLLEKHEYNKGRPYKHGKKF